MTEYNAAALPPDWPWGFWGHFGVFTVILIVFIFALALGFIYIERRLLGRFQSRLGPNRTGPFGLIQGVADAIKALTKETITPARADKLVYWLAPIVVLVPALMIFAVIPLQDGVLLADLNIGILYIVAVGSVSMLGIFMAGWASSNKYSLLAAMRSIAMVVSYEIPMGLAILGVVLMAGSLSMTEIVNSQSVPFILMQPLGFLIFFLAASAEVNRAPFDLMEAESEIVAGFHIEYSGMKFAAFYLSEYCEVLAISAIITTLFLAGWKGPWLPPILWFLIKLFAVFFVIVWIRSTIPRLRVDQIMAFAWKGLLPLALINLVVTGIQVTVWPQAFPWVLVVVNLVIMAVLILLWSKLFKLGGGRVAV